MHYELSIKKNEEREFEFPICPQLSGKYNTKILIKFEEESKFKEIEIKRFVYFIEVVPSIHSEIYEKIII